MRLALAWLALLLVAGTIAASTSSCSVNHRSNAFTCDVTADCDAGRICEDGYCVVLGGRDGGVDSTGRDGDTPNPDGRPDGIPDAPSPDASNGCPDVCTSCGDANAEPRSCIIDCAVDNSVCMVPIKCPDGFECDIRCTTAGSCREGITCAGSAGCDVTCTGQNSCRNVQCGQAPCNVVCDAQGACRGIGCSSSCACDVSCSPESDCVNVICPGLECDSFDGGCTIDRLGCDTCL